MDKSDLNTLIKTLQTQLQDIVLEESGHPPFTFKTKTSLPLNRKMNTPPNQQIVNQNENTQLADRVFGASRGDNPPDASWLIGGLMNTGQISLGNTPPVTYELDNLEGLTETMPQYVLLGESGSGKTTVLRHLALHYARQHQSNPAAPFPILLEAGAWKSRQNWKQFVENQYDRQMVKRMRRENVVVLIDGLDEMGFNTHRKIQHLRDWLDKTDDNIQVITTCRTASYGSALNLELPIVYLLPLKPEQKQTIIQQRLENPRAESLSSDELPGYTRRPFFLDMLLKVHPAHPENRGQLLRQYIQQQWENTVTDISFNEATPALTRLAFIMREENEQSFVEVAWAHNQLNSPDAQKLLTGAEKAGLMQLQDDRVRFAHEWIQSALLAEHLLLQKTLPMLETAEIDPMIRQPVPGKWDFALLLLCEIIPEPDAILQDVAGQSPYLAARLIQSGISASPETITRIRTHLLETLTSGDGRVSGLIIRLLPQLGETEIIETLMESVAYGGRIEQVIAIRTLGEIGNAAAAPVLIAAMEEKELEEEAADALIKIGSPALKVITEVLQHERWEIVYAAAKILKAIGDPAAVPDLLEVISDDEHELRWAAADALGGMGEAAVKGLQYVLEEEAAAYVAEADIRRAAATALAWNDTEVALQALLEATRNEHVDVRCAAIEALGDTGNEAAVPRLVELLGDAEYSTWAECSVDEAAADALEAIGTPQALKAVSEWEAI